MSGGIIYDTIIIGGGQSGLVAGYYLAKKGHRYCILEKESTVGNSRRNRYDSLKLFSPRFCSTLPGLPFPGKSSDCPTKDDMANYLIEYAAKLGDVIKYNVNVTVLEKQGDVFHIRSTQGDYHAKSIIVATGGFSVPSIPDLAASIKDSNGTITQIHSSEYKNISSIDTSGSVVVVGNGNSGIQIADEIAKTTITYLVYKKKRFWIEYSVMGRRLSKIFRLFYIRSHSRLGTWLQSMGEPVIGYSRKKFFSNKHIIDAGEIVSFEEGILKTNNCIINNITSIIWATGFTYDRSWIQIPGLVDRTGRLNHRGGVSSIPGLYFLGLPRQTYKSSAMILGTKKDAKFIVNKIDTYLKTYSICEK